MTKKFSIYTFFDHRGISFKIKFVVNSHTVPLLFLSFTSDFTYFYLLRDFILLLVTNMKSVFAQFMSSLLNLHQLINISSFTLNFVINLNNCTFFILFIYLIFKLSLHLTHSCIFLDIF